jgi:glycosyltransferase involved in cell wall biosynthesis
MIVGLNLLYLLHSRVGGTETYAAGLIGALAESAPDVQFRIFLNAESRDWPLPPAAHVRAVHCNVRAVSRAARYRFEQLVLPRLLAREGVDLVHSLGYVSPLRAGCPAVVTVHDLNFRAFGAEMGRRRRWMLELFVRLSVTRARRVITVSEFARQQLLAAYALPPERVKVTHEAPRATPAVTAADENGARALTGTGRPYFIAYGSTSPNKNLARLLEAYAAARAGADIPHRLVVVGHTPKTLAALAERISIGSDVVLTGYLEDGILQAVLRGADGLLFPSLYEGFGLPVLEAMAAGVPVACSNAASLPEVAGDAALLFAPTSTAEIASAVERLAGSAALREDLRSRGYRRAAQFTWAATARATLDVYAEALAGPGTQARASVPPA